MVKKQNNEISDADLFAHVFRDVKPLEGRKIKNSSTPKVVRKASLSSTASIRQVNKKAEQDNKLPLIKHGYAPGLDKRTAQRLRRGQLNVDAQLDLHGLTQAKAHMALNQFLSRAHDCGQRCVLVITGKGALSQGGGILRKMVPLWLNQIPNRNLILSFSYSRPIDGGTGALYILLKRKRA